MLHKCFMQFFNLLLWNYLLKEEILKNYSTRQILCGKKATTFFKQAIAAASNSWLVACAEPSVLSLIVVILAAFSPSPFSFITLLFQRRFKVLYWGESKRGNDCWGRGMKWFESSVSSTASVHLLLDIWKEMWYYYQIIYNLKV